MGVVCYFEINTPICMVKPWEGDPRRNEGVMYLAVYKSRRRYFLCSRNIYFSSLLFTMYTYFTNLNMPLFFTISRFDVLNYIYEFLLF
jgi:hypothetical protein